MGQFAEVSLAEEELEEPVVSYVVFFFLFVPAQHIDENGERRCLFSTEGSDGLHVTHHSSWLVGEFFLVAV